MKNYTKAISTATLTMGIFCPLALNAQSPDLGTLFTSPEERVYLDYLRDDFLAKKAEAGFDIDSTALPEIPVETTVDESEVVEFHFGGIMTRVDGGRTVWLNAKAIPERELPSTVKLVQADGATVLRLVTQENSYLLKPGQTLNVVTGEIWEAFELRLPEPEAIATPPAANNLASSDLVPPSVSDDDEAIEGPLPPEFLQEIPDAL